DAVAEDGACPPSQNDLPRFFKRFLACGWIDADDDFRVLAHAHLHFGHTRLLRRTDRASDIRLSYRRGPAAPCGFPSLANHGPRIPRANEYRPGDSLLGST